MGGWAYFSLVHRYLVNNSYGQDLAASPKRSRNRVLITIHRCILIFPEILDGFYFLDTVL